MGDNVSSAAHDAVFARTFVYYIYSFSADGPINVRNVAQRLLRADVAETVAQPDGRQVRMSPRLASLAGLRRKADALAELDNALESGSIWPWVKSHPMHALTMLVPILSRWLWRTMRSVGRNPATRDQSGGAGSPSEEVIPIEESLAHGMRAVSDEIVQAVAGVQSMSAVQGFVARQLFQPDYLEREPYLRLTLRHSSHEWLGRVGGQLAESSRDALTLDALLMLHRSGTLQLTLAMELPANLSTEDLVRYTRADRSRIARSIVPEPLLTHAAGGKLGRQLPGVWLPEIEEAVRWRETTFDAPATVGDLADLYMAAVKSAGRVKGTGHWMCYPVVCLEELSCCATRDAWLANHSADLTFISAKTEPADGFSAEARQALLPTDSSLRVDQAVYMTEASTIVATWPPHPRPEFVDHLWTVLIVEGALLQFWQLRTLLERVGVARFRRRHVRAIQEEVIFGIEEFVQSRLTFGTAVDVMNELLDRLRVERLHMRIRESLTQLEQLIQADHSYRSSRRANLLAFLAVVATVVLALPAVDQSLEILKQARTSFSLGPLAIGPIAQASPSLTLEVFLAMLTSGLILGLVIFVRLPRREKRTRRSPGVYWPWGTVEVVPRGGNDGDEVASESGSSDDTSTTP